jgi:hypothetical protein
MAGLDHGEDALDEAYAGGVVTAEAGLPPEHELAQRALSLVSCPAWKRCQWWKSRIEIATRPGATRAAHRKW